MTLNIQHNNHRNRKLFYYTKFAMLNSKPLQCNCISTGVHAIKTAI